MARDLRDNLVPFWLALYDARNGGHYGFMDLAGTVDRTAPKSTIYVARLLWFLSTVGRALGNETCLQQAARTQSFLLDRLHDRARGGLFWSATHDGRPADPVKHLYAHAFAIYGLSAHAAVTGDADSLEAAKALFVLIETRMRRPGGGYAESFDAAWRPIVDDRVARLGSGAVLTANSHLHLVEAYTALVQVWPAPGPRAALAELVRLMLDRFVAPDGATLHQMIGPALQPLPSAPSFGHDIEASWLLEAAGDVLGDPALRQRVAASLALAATVRGQLRDGGFLSNPLPPNARSLTPREWWVQAEAVIGIVNEVARGGPVEMMPRAEMAWAFIERVMIDRRGGWFEAVDGDGRPLPDKPKAGPWTDPYHQARACLEVARRVQPTPG